MYQTKSLGATYAKDALRLPFSLLVMEKGKSFGECNNDPKLTVIKLTKRLKLSDPGLDAVKRIINESVN